MSEIARILEPYGPTLPFAELVVAVNRVYHALEAERYDSTHPEIFDQLPQQWRRLLLSARARLPVGKLHVLDFGCGTGFAAAQVLASLGEGVASLTCFDTSPEMLARCQERFRSSRVPTRFVSRQEELFAKDGHAVDLIVTNSLLHHLPDPMALFRELRRRLPSARLWISGHEPSARFYLRQECMALLRAYRLARRLGQIVSPRAYMQAAARMMGRADDVATRTARRAYEEGLFLRQPSSETIDRLVDLHVAHSPEEVKAGRGLDFEKMQCDLAGIWQPLDVVTYSFLGPYSQTEAAWPWRYLARAVGDHCPRDGANFSVVWMAA